MRNSELLNGNTSVEETHKENSGNNLIERVEMEGTPFVAIKMEEGGWFLTMGNHRLTEEVSELHILEEMVSIKSWNLLMNVMTVFYKELDKISAK